MFALEEKIKKAIGKIKPQIQLHGGDLELAGIKNGEARLRILGACLGCPYAQLTFGEEMKRLLKKEIPEIKKIKFVA